MFEYINIFCTLLKRDLVIAIRDKTDFINSLTFFVIIIFLFPLTYGTDSELIMKFTPGMIWISALLATCLSLEGVFRSDFEDGTIEQLTLSRYPLTLISSAKIMAHWIIYSAPLIVISLFMSLILSLPLINIPSDSLLLMFTFYIESYNSSLYYICIINYYFSLLR